MKKFLNKFFIVGILLLIATCLIHVKCFYLQNREVKISKGVIDLTNWDFNKDGIIKLKGECEIYFKEFLNPSQVKLRKGQKYFNVPGKLRKQLGNKFKGYMTLHFKVLLPKNKLVYGLKIDNMLTASKIWINNIYQGGHGKVGKNKKEEKAIYLPDYCYFSGEKGVVDVVIQTSNYRDIDPIIRRLYFGTKDEIMKLHSINLGLDLFIAGSLFIMALYHISLYLLRKKEKQFLYFFVLCFLVLLRSLILNERMLIKVHPSIPYELISKTAAITYYAWTGIFVLFLKEVFKNFSQRIVHIVVCISSIFTIICLMTSSEFYDSLALLGQGFVFVLAIYLFDFLFKEIKKNSVEAKISFLGFCILLIAVTNDILVNNGLINHIYIFQLGMCIFVFLHSYMIALNFSNRFNYLEKLTEENKKIYELSIRDGLTKLYNRAYIQDILIKQVEKFKDTNENFSVIMMDIDHFKKINDTYGHPFGDEVLIAISDILREFIRKKDYIGRYGGEEFLIVLPNTDKQKALNIGEKIRKSIEGLSWKYSDFKVTCSFGVYENKEYSIKECVKKVDELLYLAKKNGRNCIESQIV